MTTRPRTWCIVSAVLMAVLGAAGSYWYWAKQAELLLVIDATNRVVLFSNLLRQLERNDVDGARSAHRALITSAGTALDVLAPVGSPLASMPEVVAARRMVQEVNAQPK